MKTWNINISGTAEDTEPENDLLAELVKSVAKSAKSKGLKVVNAVVIGTSNTVSIGPVQIDMIEEEEEETPKPKPQVTVPTKK